MESLDALLLPRIPNVSTSKSRTIIVVGGYKGPIPLWEVILLSVICGVFALFFLTWLCLACYGKYLLPRSPPLKECNLLTCYLDCYCEKNHGRDRRSYCAITVHAIKIISGAFIIIWLVKAIRRLRDKRAATRGEPSYARVEEGNADVPATTTTATTTTATTTTATNKVNTRNDGFELAQLSGVNVGRDRSRKVDLSLDEEFTVRKLDLSLDLEFTPLPSPLSAPWFACSNLEDRPIWASAEAAKERLEKGKGQWTDNE